MTAIIALVVFVALIIVWNAVVKRNIGEAMILGFVGICVVALLGNAQTGKLSLGEAVWKSITDAFTEEIMFAALGFVLMAYILEQTPVLGRLVDLLNSLFGRFRGGHLYTTTVAGAVFGSIAHIGAAITAAVGSITIPWMKRSGVKPELAATVAAGLAGFGVSFPFSGTMFILVGGLEAQGAMEANEIVVPLFFAGLWALAYRLIAAFVMVRRNGIPAVPASERLPLRQSFAAGWSTILLVIPILIPLALTVGPIAELLGGHAGIPPVGVEDGPEDMSDVISLLTWMPILMIGVILVLARRSLPRRPREWFTLVERSAPSVGVIGITIIAAFAAANMLRHIGLAPALEGVLEGLSIPKWLMVLAVGAVIIIIAIPLTASATMAAVGPVAVMTLASVGIPVPVAAAATLIFASTEGASPPSGAPIYVAAGIAEVNPVKTFVPLIGYFCVPILGLGALIALGILPV